MKNPISPELATQLVDPTDAERYSAGSNTKVQWRCPDDPRHIWSAAPNTRKRSTACPVCLNKIILPGVNDLATTHPELAATLADPADATITHAGSHAKLDWRCTTDSRHRWSASVVSRVRLDAGCPVCAGRVPLVGVTDLATTHPEIAARLVDPGQATTVGAGSAKKLTWRCTTDPGHTWSAPVRNVCGTDTRKPTGCPHCLNRGARTSTRTPTLGQINAPVLADAVDPVHAARLSQGSGVVLDWHCRQCPTPHTYAMSVRHKLRGQSCPVAAGTMILPGVNDLATTHPNIAAHIAVPYDPALLSKGSMRRVHARCDHGHVWSVAVYALVAGNGCPECNPIGSSYGEQHVYDVVRVLDPNASHRAQLRLNGPDERSTEVDVLAGADTATPLAIEFNGLYWHSEAHRSPTSHRDKADALHNAGYRLVTIWEDQWADPVVRAVIVRSLAHQLGARALLRDAMTAADVGDHYDPHMTATHGARTLAPTTLTGAQARAFFTENHLQGATTLTRTYGLVDADGIIHAALGLRDASHNARLHRKPGHWDIQRYATYAHVPGGFTRLLAHATRDIHLNLGRAALTRWVTLSAHDYSTGNLYRGSGFTPDAEIPPNYWYTGGRLRGRRAPKESYQLHRFRTDPELTYEDGWTERDAAQANNLLRVYDTGKTRWIKDV